MQRRLPMRGSFPRARVVFKAARFRAPRQEGLVQLRAAARCLRQPVNAPLIPAGCNAPRSRARCMASTPKRKDITMSNTSKLPSHRVYAVTKNGQRNYWREIGAAWAHSDGEGLRAQARLPAAQRRRDRHPQAEGRRGRRPGSRITNRAAFGRPFHFQTKEIFIMTTYRARRPSNPSLPKRNRSLVTPPVKFRILKIHAAETRRGKRPPRWEAPDFPRQRPAHCPLTLGNVGGSPTPGNHTAETGLAGWGARIRTWEWRNQNRMLYVLLQILN
jgi:hypothetical protein